MKSEEQIVEALSEVVAEEPVKDQVEIELHLEEDAAEKESQPEEVQEETQAEEPHPEETKKSRKGWLIAAIVVAVVLVAAAGVYVGVSKRYEEAFMMGTRVNGVDCSGMTLQKVEKLLQNQVEQYTLTIEKKDGSTEEIKGTDIGIVYNGHSQLKEAFEKQNSYTWPMALFETTDVKAEIDFEYDSAKLNEQINALECLKAENQIAPVAATVVYQDGAFVIQDESYGTQLHQENLSAAIIAAVSSIESRLNLEEQGCYVQPRFTKESPEVIAAKDEMNKYLTANITYNYETISVALDKTLISQWITVDENMTPQISTEGVKSFAATLASKYNTPNRAGQITTPTGKVADVALAGYGRSVGTAEETQQLLNEIKEGKTVTREPIFSQTATPEGQTIWGATYVEVDISEQHMWYIVNGTIALETDVVTGKRGSNDTPAGTFTILEKTRNRVLRGRPLANGKPSYLTPVDYWMRVTWSGIGFHDANWQPTFGGERYLTNGSHGCINMPPDMAGQLFGMLQMGTPVVIHY